MTDSIPKDNTCEMEIDSTIIDLVDKCARLKATMDAATKAFKMAKSELETLCDEHNIREVTANQASVTIKKTRRFREYRDVDAVRALIPEEIRDHTMSLDRKKINELISAGVLPNAIKDEEAYTESVTTTFKKVQ
jgi:hypothetical protein